MFPENNDVGHFPSEHRACLLLTNHVPRGQAGGQIDAH